MGKVIALFEGAEMGPDLGAVLGKDLAPEIRSDRQLVERRTFRGVTVQLERVRCGKDNCRCAAGGRLHGPYWYAYRWWRGKVRSRYVGKSLERLPRSWR